MKISILALVLAALGIAPLGACSKSAPAKIEPLTVQLSIYPQGTDAYLFLALQKGWFKEAGLDVNILDGRGSNYAMQVLTSNHADIGEGTLTPLVFAHQRGAKALAVAEVWPGMGPAVIAAKSAGIATPADLKGKRVAIASAGPWPPLLTPFLARFGLKDSDLQLQYVDVNSLFSSYVNKQVDAILTVDTAITETAPLRDSVLMKAAAYGVQLPGAGLFATQDTLSGPKGAAISRFLAVCVKALDYVYAGHEAEGAAAIIAERPNEKLSQDVLLSQVNLYRPEYEDFKKSGSIPGHMDPKTWSDQIAYMKTIGMIDTAFNPTEIYSNAFLPGSAK